MIPKSQLEMDGIAGIPSINGVVGTCQPRKNGSLRKEKGRARTWERNAARKIEERVGSDVKEGKKLGYDE